MVDMRVRAIGVDARRAQPMVLLQEAGGGRVLPIWIGRPEAEALERARRNITAPRPDTHRLISLIVEECGRRLTSVTVTELNGTVFHAELELDDRTRVSARPSDALVLALQQDLPIRVAEAVLEQAGIPAAAAAVEFGDGDVDAPAEEAGSGDDEAAEVERFRRFLDSASPEDFDTS